MRMLNKLPGEQDGGQANGWGISVAINTISSFNVKMTSPCRISANSGFDYLEAVFMFFLYKMRYLIVNSKKMNPLFV